MEEKIIKLKEKGDKVFVAGCQKDYWLRVGTLIKNIKKPYPCAIGDGSRALV